MTKNQPSLFDLFTNNSFKEEETKTVSLTTETANSEESSNAISDVTALGFNKQFETNSTKVKESDKKNSISTFDDTETSEAEAILDAKAAAKPKSKLSTTGTKPKGDTFKLRPDTLVKYAGAEIPVARYFTADEITNGLPVKKGSNELKQITDKQLISKLNDDFAELMPDLTSLVFYDKRNIVVPVLQAKTKGATTVEESSKDGSFSSIEKIPFVLLNDFINVAKYFDENFQTEIHADIYYDFDDKNYFMDFPEQRVHKYWADRTEDAFTTAEKFIDLNYRKVMEIHSHHVLIPTPSATDDASERSPILYAIVGKTDDFFPSLTVRTFNPITKQHIPLNVSDVFESPFTKDTKNYNLDVVEVVK